MEKRSEIVDVIMKESSLILDSGLIDKLKAKTGDRIQIGYIEKDESLVPIISIGDNGNKLTSNNTVSFRGHQREVLAQFGSNFWAKEENGIFYLEGNGLPVYTTVKKAVNSYLTREIIEDTNFNITKLEKYDF